MNYAYLLIGGNIGRREDQLAMAGKLLEERCARIIDRSSLYETAAWGKTDQASFLNQALVVETRLTPTELLEEILYIENLMGRNRTEKYGPRIIDIDIIFFNHLVVNSPELTLPHPGISTRRFVLEPLAEIIPAYIHPLTYQTVKQLLQECADPLEVKKIESV